MTHSHRPKRLKNHYVFIILFSLVFITSFSTLYVLGLIPGELVAGDPRSSLLDDLKFRILGQFDNTEVPPILIQNTGVNEEPTYIEIPKIAVSINVQNPESTNVSVLDEYLRKGAVRYPGSGQIGNGNMFIFGHNAEIYKNVTNKALKAFNGLEDLVVGDEIYVKSATKTYTYRVTSQKKTTAEEAFVDFSVKESMLTLSTCNTFGKKQERFVVEAKFVGMANQ